MTAEYYVVTVIECTLCGGSGWLWMPNTQCYRCHGDGQQLARVPLVEALRELGLAAPVAAIPQEAQT